MISPKHGTGRSSAEAIYKIAIGGCVQKISYFIAKFLYATMVTMMFGFASLLGASSALWGLGFVALGAGIDYSRSLYRYNWDIHRFVRSRWDGPDFFTELEQLNADSALFKKRRRLGRFFYGGLTFACLISVIFLLCLGRSYEGIDSCEASKAHKLFSYVSVHLAYTAHSIPSQLVEHGYICRSIFVEIYYAATFYMFVVIVSAYAIFWSYDSTLLHVAHLARTEGMEKLIWLTRHTWRTVLAYICLQLLSYATLFRMMYVDFNPHHRRTWNVHESNYNLVMFSILVMADIMYIWISLTACRFIIVRFWLRNKALIE